MGEIRLVGDWRSNYPKVEGAGILGDIVNKRWSEQWVAENNPTFLSFDSMALNVLIEDYNERHPPQTDVNTNGGK